MDGAGSEVAGQIGEGHCQDWIYNNKNKGWADEQVSVWVCGCVGMGRCVGMILIRHRCMAIVPNDQAWSEMLRIRGGEIMHGDATGHEDGWRKRGGHGGRGVWCDVHVGSTM